MSKIEPYNAIWGQCFEFCSILIEKQQLKLRLKLRQLNFLKNFASLDIQLMTLKSQYQCTGCVISLGTEFQMGVTQKWLKPRPQNFLQLFTRVFCSFYENF